VYNGTVGNTYAFFSVAYDNVGNAESVVGKADQAVSVTTSETLSRTSDTTVTTVTKASAVKALVGA